LAAAAFAKVYREITAGDIGGREIWNQAVEESVSEIVEKHGLAVATAFQGVATGTATPRRANLDAWLMEPGSKGPLTEKAKSSGSSRGITKGRGAEDLLIQAPGKDTRDASGKRFGTCRTVLGVVDKAAGRRQERIDFHSFRLWFTTPARVGFDRGMVAAIVGHENGNVTDDV
jgi:hypothetical protein